MVRAGLFFQRKLECSLHHWIWEKMLPPFPRTSLAPARDGGCFITGRVQCLPREAAEISHQRKKPPHSRSCPQPGPLQGPGQRDECLCVSVAVCVLSSLCSVGGLLFLCIVTLLTVVETATPINSSQELCLWLYTSGFITNGNKLNGLKFPSTKLPWPPQPAR